MSYYKYLSNSRVDVLENGLIRFTQPSAFNDPFEALPTYKTLGEEFTLKNVSDEVFKPFLNGKRALSNGTHIFTDREIESFRTKWHQKLTRIESKLTVDITRVLRNGFDKSYGILSLTKNPKSILMWSHYANNHQGYLLELDEHHSFFSAHFKHGSVIYSSIRSEDELIPKEGFDLSCTLFKKSIHWAYEEEWRAVAELKKSKKRIVNKPFDIHLFELPRDAIKSITLGNSTPIRIRNKIQRLISTKRQLTHIRLFRARIDPSEFDLQYDEF